MSADAESRCRLCGGAVEFRFRRQVLRVHEVAYLQCQSCGSLQTEYPYWNQEDRHHAPSLDTSVVGPQRALRNWLLLTDAFSRCALPRSKRLVDMGEDTGLFAQLLRSSGYDCSYYDPSAAPFYARDHHLATLAYESCDVVTAFELPSRFVVPQTELAGLFAATPALVLTTIELWAEQGPAWDYLAADYGKRVFFYSEQALQKAALLHGYDFVSGSSYRIFVRRSLRAAPFCSALVAELARAQLSTAAILSGIRSILEEPEPLRRDLAVAMARLLQAPSPSTAEQATAAAQIAWAEQLVTEYERSLASVHTSLSWRLTSPLRRLRRTASAARLRALALQQRQPCREIAASGEFDRDFYLQQVPELAELGVDPIIHYLADGAQRGLQPGSGFDGAAYLAANTDVRTSGLNPLLHYIRFGKREGRNPLPRKKADAAVASVAVHLTAAATELSPPPAPAPTIGQVEAGPDTTEPLTLPACEQPRVSVIIPVYGKSELTYLCLRSIIAAAPALPFEVIVVDDGSRDDTQQVLARVANLRVLINEENLGYLRSCNRGAALARGEYVLLLNNDCEVAAGWMEELVAVFESDAQAGLVGSKLVKWDGTLQEAGVHIDRIGNGIEIGYGEPPESPAYNFLREVVYCAGASIMLPRALYEELHGLDELFLPCYYEDSDLALRVRQSGKKVLYQPRSVVRHRVSATTGTSSHQVIEVNRPKFRARWQPLLDQLNEIRTIAFYHSQFYPTELGDRLFGKGFTDWMQVTRAQPRFVGHAQPQLPSELGFYDLRLSEVQKEQAALARAHGISGFCYRYLWFPEQKHLNLPLSAMLAAADQDQALPFCVLWDNADWQRSPDDRDSEVLLRQQYSDDNARAMLRELLPALSDRRYIRISGRPLLAIARPDLLPAPAHTAELWRELCQKEGIGDIYLAYLYDLSPQLTPSIIGFDAAIEFPPAGQLAVPRDPPGSLLVSGFAGQCFDYAATSQRYIDRPLPGHVLFRCAMPRLDSTPRTPHRARIAVDSSPERYEKWLRALREKTHRYHIGDERIVFIASWNDWAGGCYLEPDQVLGRRYLEATRRATEQE